ncbi:hypothetical protein P9112_010346 [Eukaryota sp. TZLM1-RC]
MDLSLFESSLHAFKSQNNKCKSILSKAVERVVFLLTLIEYSYFNFYFSDDDSWNLYGFLRHAPRNLCVEDGLKTWANLLVVDSGTHTNLSNLQHSKARESEYRPVVLKLYSLLETQENTLLPIFVTPPQLYPQQILPNELFVSLGEYVYDMLTYETALSVRPIWIGHYCPNHTGFLAHVSRTVENALIYSASKSAIDTSHNVVLVALLLLCCSTCSLPQHVLSTMVDCTFSSIKCQSSTDPNLNTFVSVQMIDPLVEIRRVRLALANNSENDDDFVSCNDVKDAFS